MVKLVVSHLNLTILWTFWSKGGVKRRVPLDTGLLCMNTFIPSLEIPKISTCTQLLLLFQNGISSTECQLPRGVDIKSYVRYTLPEANEAWPNGTIPGNFFAKNNYDFLILLLWIYPLLWCYCGETRKLVNSYIIKWVLVQNLFLRKNNVINARSLHSIAVARSSCSPLQHLVNLCNHWCPSVCFLYWTFNLRNKKNLKY